MIDQLAKRFSAACDAMDSLNESLLQVESVAPHLLGRPVRDMSATERLRVAKSLITFMIAEHRSKEGSAKKNSAAS